METGQEPFALAILGAGSIGCHVGGALAAAGHAPVLVGRAAVKTVIDRDGLKISDLDGGGGAPERSAYRFETDPAALSPADVVIVAVKSGDTREAAGLIARHGKPGAAVISLQNGVGNAALLRELLPGHPVTPGMVSFNVVLMPDGRFHRSTGGEIVLGETQAGQRVASALRRSGIPARTATDMEAVQWSKLTMNLNNAVNVLSGMPLKAQLLDRDYRRVLAASISEALAVMKAKGIRPVRIGKVDPRISPFVLRLPTALFRMLASSMLKIGDDARSSMWDDLVNGRRSEVDFLNGAVVAHGREAGVATPVNAAIAELVRQAFAEGRSPRITGRELAGMVLAG